VKTNGYIDHSPYSDVGLRFGFRSGSTSTLAGTDHVPSSARRRANLLRAFILVLLVILLATCSSPTGSAGGGATDTGGGESTDPEEPTDPVEPTDPEEPTDPVEPEGPFSISYHPNGAETGDVPVDENEYESGEVATIRGPADLRHGTYAFESWNTRPDGSGERLRTGREIAVMQDIDLYAQWLSFSGDPRLDDGWRYVGHSMEQGLYAKGTGNYGYDIYVFSMTLQSAGPYHPEVFRYRHHEDVPDFYGEFYLNQYLDQWDPFAQASWEVGDRIVGIGGVFRTVDDPTELGWPERTAWDSVLPPNSTSYQSYRLAIKLSPYDDFRASTASPPNANGDSGLKDFHVYVRSSEWDPISVWIDYGGEMMGVRNGASWETQVVAVPYQDKDYRGDRNAFRFIWTYDEENRRPATWQIIINETLYAEWVAENQNYDGIWSIRSIITSVQYANNAYTDARLGPEFLIESPD